MAKAVKLADIAMQLGVSTVTVSKALSGQKGVSEAMREKIKQLADELGYKQPSAARKEKADKSYNIGVLVSEKYLGEYASFYWKLYQSVATRAVQKECFTMLEVVSQEDEDAARLPKIVLEQKADGLIVIGKLRSEYLGELRQSSGIPVVYLDFYDEHQMSDAVISNSYYGTYMLTNYLFDKGHRKIAYVGTLLATASITDRYFGYAKSMLEHGQQIAGEWVIPDRDMRYGVVRVDIDPKSMDDAPTAFVCNSDLTASMLIGRLEELGYRVPEDFSVVGFDNYLYPGLCDVEITTYEVDLKEMAVMAIRVLLKKMGGERYKQGISIIEGRMVEKDSVSMCRDGKFSET